MACITTTSETIDQWARPIAQAGAMQRHSLIIIEGILEQQQSQGSKLARSLHLILRLAKTLVIYQTNLSD